MGGGRPQRSAGRRPRGFDFGARSLVAAPANASIMKSLRAAFLLACLPAASAVAQSPGALLTFSEPEMTISMGGGPLQWLRPNEIAFLPLPAGCANGALTEKWSPRTCFNVMAGDQNNDGQLWHASLFGTIDALATGFSHFGPIAPNPRNVYWSPAATMGSVISASPLRPGDIGRIGPGGQVELLMSQEQFNYALGLVPDFPIDIDAFAYEPGLGIYFSIHSPTPIPALTACSSGWVQIHDGDLFAIPPYAISFSLGYQVAGVWPVSAHRVKTEADIDALLANCQITDRTGAVITSAGDLESLDIYHGPGSQITMFPSPCLNPVPVPDFLFSTSTMTGGSLASTVGGGQPAMGPCGFLGIPSPYGLQNGSALGIQQQLAGVGPASYVNAVVFGTTERFVLEPVTHQLNYGLLGGPPTMLHLGGDFNFVFTWIDIVSATIPASFSAWPFSLNCFPDWYCPSNLLWNFGMPTNGFHSFATANIPVGWSGKLLFQSVGFDSVTTSNLQFEISTPCVLDVN